MAMIDLLSVELTIPKSIKVEIIECTSILSGISPISNSNNVCTAMHQHIVIELHNYTGTIIKIMPYITKFVFEEKTFDSGSAFAMSYFRGKAFVILKS